MTAGRWTTALAGCMLAVLANDAGGQTPKTASKASKGPAAAAKTTPARPSTLSGVYTKEQATRGRYVYLGSCRYCHDAATHAGKVFEEWWKGKQLSELYTFILERMPKNDPGGMFPEEYAQVVAYLLKLNGQPAGSAELPSDSLVLKTIRFEAAEKVRKRP